MYCRKKRKDSRPVGKRLVVPDNPVILAGMEGIWKGGPQAQKLAGGWTRSPLGAPEMRCSLPRGGVGTVGMLLPPDFPRTNSEWELVHELSPFVADVALACLALMADSRNWWDGEPHYPMLTPVRVSTRDIAELKAIRRWGEERKEFYRRINRAMWLLKLLVINAKGSRFPDPITGKPSKEGINLFHDHLFDVVKMEKVDEDTLMWGVRPGQWGYWFFHAHARIWVAGFGQELLELDHRLRGPQGELMAKKIGQYICLVAPRSGELMLGIGRLLETVGEMLRPEYRHHSWIGRTKERFDSALLALLEEDLFTDIEWPKGFGPGETPKAKGWSQEWLNQKVKIVLNRRKVACPPASVLVYRSERGKEKEETENAAASASDGVFKGIDLIRLRKDLGWTQKELAEKLGVSRAYISVLEAHNRKVPPWLAEKIRKMESHPLKKAD